MMTTKRVLAVGAHPDDVEFMCAGLLILLREAGCEIHVATLSLGDVGSMACDPEELRRIRREEATTASGVIGATYHALDFWDFSIFNDDQSNRRVTGLLREVDPSIVITHPPQDYLADHEATSTLVRNGCFYASVPNYESSQGTSAVRTSSIPYLYYAHPMEGTDNFGCPVVPQMFIDITSVFSLKRNMLACHKSQRDWLRQQHGIDEYVESMGRWGRMLGWQASAICGRPVECAEAYRQHRGHAYPQHNVLAELLAGFTIPASTSGIVANVKQETKA
jgi:LmbE family N-acetylglucosaminyl deacetylase